MDIKMIEGDDGELIDGFLSSFDSLMTKLVGKHSIYLKDFRISHTYTKLMNEAWTEIQVVINKVRLTINNSYKKLNGKMRDYGLTGQQLRYKLTVYYYILEKYYYELSYRMFKRLMESMDAILKSLSKVFPLLEQACEFKDIFMQTVSTRKNEYSA